MRPHEYADELTPEQCCRRIAALLAVGLRRLRSRSAHSVYTRPYKGQTVQVQVLHSGFAYQGQVYPSLSAVAKAVTGSHCNSFLFFRNTLHNQPEKR